MATDKSKRAGKAFLEAALRDGWGPQLRKLERKLQLLGRTIQAVSADAELAEIRRQYDIEMRRLAAEDKVELEEVAAAWEERYGERYPRDVEDWERLAIYAGYDFKRIDVGDWAPGRIASKIEGFLLQQKAERAADKLAASENDDTIYVPMSELWPDRFATAAKCTKFLDKTTEIRWRKPSANRRNVHAGEWHRYWKKLDRKSFDLLGSEALQEQIADIEAAKNEARLHRK